MKRIKISTIVWTMCLCIISMTSCNKSPKKPPIDLSKSKSSNMVQVPYTLRNNSIIIPIKLNGVSMDAIYDTGFSGSVHISLLELQSLTKQGQFSQADVIGSSYSCIADGSIVENGVVLLHSVQIAEGVEIKNVEATVALNQEAPILLGKQAMDEVASAIEVDNVSNVLNITPW